MTANELAKEVFHKMYDNDAFSQLLGIELIEISEGYCKLKMLVRKDMLNGFNILHGGVSFSLADSAFAFASNSYGRMSVSIDTTMTYPAAAKEGDTLFAEAKMVNLTNKTGLFDVIITNQNDVKVGLFRGTVYRTAKEYFPKENEI